MAAQHIYIKIYKYTTIKKAKMSKVAHELQFNRCDNCPVQVPGL